MKQVAKLVIIDADNHYLLMYRSDHPTFGRDPDLPGGTLEEGETLVEAMLREVFEEAGIEIDSNSVEQAYSGSDYSAHGTHYALFIARLSSRPEVKMSWEHSAYEWMDRPQFLLQAKNAKDTFMHMAHDIVNEI